MVVAKIVWDADGLLPISKKNDEISPNAKEDMPKIAQAPKDWNLEEKSKKEDAKKKAAEVMKKLRETGSTRKRVSWQIQSKLPRWLLCCFFQKKLCEASLDS